MSHAVFVSTGKELIKQAHIEKQLQNTYKTQISLESEVVALSNYQKPPVREQTRELIAKQKESRRDRHIKATKEFEKWVERLTKNIDEAYKDIRQDVIGFFEESDHAINAYYESLTDDKLLSREIEFIDDLKNIIHDHKSRRDDKVSNLDQRLDELEDERTRSLQFFRDKYFNNLFEISFILEPQIRQIIAQHQKDHEQVVADKKAQNDDYVQLVNTRQKDTFIKYEQMRKDKEQRWRELKHDKYIQDFLTDIKKWDYVNPTERVALYQKFKET